MKCPHCDVSIETLCYSARYSERIYGSSSGTYYISDGTTECDDQSSEDSEDFVEDELSYSCSNCNESVEPDELIPEDDDEEVHHSSYSVGVARKEDKTFYFIRDNFKKDQ